MNEKPAIIGVELGQLEQSCFVVMPFASLFKTQYESVIRPAVEQCGLRCVRGEEIYSRPRIMDDIWKSIRASRLVVAELTGKDPNVLYEVGLAQAIGKPVVILTREENDVPFDLKDLRYLYYDTDNPFWGESLQSQLKEVIEKVLQEETLSTYLEGIKPVHKLSFPSPEEPKTGEQSKPSLSVVGVWRASPELDMAHVESYEKILNLSQSGKALNAMEVVTYFIEKTPTVVQQLLTGLINGNSVILNGTSYTFIQRGKEKTYILDNYELELSPDGNEMKGLGIDADGVKAEIVFLRTTDVKS